MEAEWASLTKYLLYSTIATDIKYNTGGETGKVYHAVMLDIHKSTLDNY
jgi:membrane protein involved in colicin uptake